MQEREPGKLPVKHKRVEAGGGVGVKTALWVVTCERKGDGRRVG